MRLRLWKAAKPIAGTLAARYLADARRIDLAALPASIDDVLRFHPRCTFGPGNRHPCLLALMRDAETDEPTGIHRIALTPDARKIERRMLLGRSGRCEAVAGGTAVRYRRRHRDGARRGHPDPYDGAPLRPAWSAVSSRLRFDGFPSLPASNG